MEVDRIITESLIGTPELAGILKDFGLPGDFDLTSYRNLLPAHSRCNGKKNAHVFRATPIVQQALDTCAEKEPRVTDALKTLSSKRILNIAITKILAAHEEGTLDPKQMQRLAKIAATVTEPLREPEKQGTPFYFAPGLKLIGETPFMLHMQGPSEMVGSRPKGDHLHHSFDCPYCGPTAWNCTRCVSCGRMMIPTSGNPLPFGCRDHRTLQLFLRYSASRSADLRRV